MATDGLQLTRNFADSTTGGATSRRIGGQRFLAGERARARTAAPEPDDTADA